VRYLHDFRPYQHDALAFLERTPRAYLAAKAGAGKTGVALALANSLMYDQFSVRRTLVVAPKRVAKQWPNEAKNWAFSGHLRFAVYVGSPEERKAALASDFDVLTVSFDFFPELMKLIRLKDWDFDLVIFDEASRLRKGGRKGSVGWKAMNTMARRTDSRIVLMSGSPRPGTAHELFAPVGILDGGQRLGKTLTGFRADYLEPKKLNRHTGQVYSWKLRQGMESKLYERISDLYFAVAPDLGLRSVVVDRKVTLPAKVATAIRTLMRNQVVDIDAITINAPSQGVVSGKAHQMCQGAIFTDEGVSVMHNEKLDELAEIIEEVDGPLLVCHWYTHDFDRIKARFPEAVDITTEEGMEAAMAGKVELALLNPGSAGHGVDGLQHQFSAICWFAIPASFELYDQANKRIVRSGQEETVRIFRISAENGIVDGALLDGLAEKEAEQDEFFKYLEGRHETQEA